MNSGDAAGNCIWPRMQRCVICSLIHPAHLLVQPNLLLQVLKKLIVWLNRERLSANEHSRGDPGGPEVAELAAQFRAKHEELQQSLSRLHGTVSAKHSGQEAYQLLLDAVEVGHLFPPGSFYALMSDR